MRSNGSPCVFASLDQGVHDKRSAVRRRIGIDELQTCLDVPAVRDFIASQLRFFAALQSRLRFIDVAHIDFHPHAAGDAVDGAGKNVAYADRAHGVIRAAGSRARFHCQGDLGRRKKRIVPIRHQYGSGMTAFAFDDDS